MGNSQNKFQQKFTQKYEFIQFFKDNNFGPIKIYRKKEPGYDYVMIISKIIQPEQKQIYKEEIEHLQECFRMEEEPSFLRIFGYQFIESDNSVKCDNSCKVRIYTEYLNYTLKDLIHLRLEQGNRFKRDQVMYILSSCLKIYHQYQNLTIATISFKSDCIFLTPQGQIKFSSIKVEQHQNEDILCNGSMKCYPTKIVKNFKKSKKQFIFEFKKLLSQLVQFDNTISYQTEQMFKLVKRVNSANNIQQLFKVIQLPKIQKLSFSNKDQNQFNQRPSQARIKDSPLGTNSQFSINSKLSVKNIVKQHMFQNTR